MDKVQLEYIKAGPIGRYKIVTIDDIDKLIPVVNELIKQKWLLIDAYERLEKQYVELIGQLTDTFAQEIVDHEQPANTDAAAWQDEYLKLNRDMLAWMRRARQKLGG